jgi:hypothetical protein
VDEKLVIAAAPPRRGAPAAATLFRGFAPARALAARAPGLGAPPPAATSPPPVQMLFTSLGVPTGEAFEVDVLNRGDRPVTLGPMQLVLQPLKAEAGRRLRDAFRRAAGARRATVKMTGYCLDLHKLPPAAGMVFRVAPAAVQERSRPAQQVLLAALALQKAGKLKPDGDPEGYFHSIRQWAMWARRERLTRESFTRAFVDQVKKDMAAARQPWTPEAEAYVRGAAPHRWSEIEAILKLADDAAPRMARR